jgi:hypothetical protein
LADTFSTVSLSDASCSDLAQLSTAELVQLCQYEYRRYCVGGRSDERFAFELFRRAITLRNDDSWQALVEIYTPLVATWIRKLEKGRWLVEQNGLTVFPALVNAVFLKFFLALGPPKFANFPTLAALLAYLRLCTHTVVYDEWQHIQLCRAHEEALGSSVGEHRFADPIDAVEAAQRVQLLWEAITALLNTRQEQAVVVCLYFWGMRPGEISASYPRLFPKVADVYRVKQNILERLRHNQELQARLRE